MLWFKLKPWFEQNKCFCVQTLFYTKNCFTQILCYPQTPCFTQKPCSCWVCARAVCSLQDSSFHGGRRKTPKAVKYLEYPHDPKKLPGAIKLRCSAPSHPTLLLKVLHDWHRLLAENFFQVIAASRPVPCGRSKIASEWT